MMIMAARTLWVWWSPEVGAMTALDLKRVALVEIQRDRKSSTECTWSLDVLSVCPTNSQKETARQICRNGIIVYIVLWTSFAWALFWTNSFRQSGPWSLKRIVLVVAQNELAEQYFNFRSKCSIPWAFPEHSLQLPKNSKYATNESIIRRDSSQKISV